MPSTHPVAWRPPLNEDTGRRGDDPDAEREVRRAGRAPAGRAHAVTINVAFALVSSRAKSSDARYYR